MDSYMAIGLCVIAIAGLAIMYLASVYSESRSLADAKVGQIYNFEYEQPYHGERKRVLAKVIEPVYTLNDESIRNLNKHSYYRRHDPVFQRTKHIVVCQTANGEIRQFYAERAKNVRRSLFGGALVKSGIAAMIW